MSSLPVTARGERDRGPREVLREAARWPGGDVPARWGEVWEGRSLDPGHLAVFVPGPEGKVSVCVRGGKWGEAVSHAVRFLDSWGSLFKVGGCWDVRVLEAHEVWASGGLWRPSQISTSPAPGPAPGHPDTPTLWDSPTQAPWRKDMRGQKMLRTGCELCSMGKLLFSCSVPSLSTTLRRRGGRLRVSPQLPATMNRGGGSGGAVSPPRRPSSFQGSRSLVLRRRQVPIEPGWRLRP